MNLLDRNNVKRVKAYELGRTVSEAITKLKNIVESKKVVEIVDCGTVRNINDIFALANCIEKRILAYRLEKWRAENRKKAVGRPRGSEVDLYRDEIVKLISSGHTLSETCEILGLKISRVSKWMKRNGLTLSKIRGEL